MKPYFFALLAAAFAAAPLRAADFIETVTGEAPLKSQQDEEACAKAAEAALSSPRENLQKQCDEGSGQFNSGLVTTAVHRRSCSAYQTVTCSGTEPRAAKTAAAPQPTATAAPKAKPRKAKKRPSSNGEDALAPKPAAVKRRKKNAAPATSTAGDRAASSAPASDPAPTAR